MKINFLCCVCDTCVILKFVFLILKCITDSHYSISLLTNYSKIPVMENILHVTVMNTFESKLMCINILGYYGQTLGLNYGICSGQSCILDYIAIYDHHSYLEEYLG